jgi:FtsH-binding integral membrane protein
MERLYNAVATRDYSLIAKVYGLLALSLIMATVGNIVGISHLQIIASYKWIFFIGEIALVFVLSFIANNKELQTLGFVLLNIFTFLSGFTLAPLIAYALKVDPAAIVYALSTTAGTFILMSIVGFIFKDKISGMGTFLFAGIIALLIGSLLNLFFHSGTVALVISILAVVIFSLYISYDTVRILESEPDASPIGLALSLYIDVLNIFVNTLELFLSFANNKD